MRATDAGRAMRLAGRALTWLGGIVAVAGIGTATAADKGKVEKGRELFLREWTPGDPRSHGGDGLGPVFNDSSCVACHNAGGTGGAGPASKNVDILSAFANGAQQQQQLVIIQGQNRTSFAAKAAEALLGIDPPKPQTPPAPPKPRKPDTGPLIKAHAGFRTTRSVVLHRFGVEPEYETWRTSMLGLDQFFGGMNPFPNMTPEQNAATKLQRTKMLAQFKSNMNGQQGSAGEFSLLRSQRNPTALFGAGLMDAIPDSVLIAAAEAQRKADPATAGRVARQKDGRIGRFGWKAQTPSLNDFVLTACAVELGLEVPGHGQGGLPQKPDVKAKGLDMNAEECDELVAYVKGLAKPVELKAHTPDVAAGKAVFGKIGCASCHMPKLGDVDGIYSDLLVHDLGPDLGDTGQYGVFTPGSADPEFQDDPTPPAGGGGPVAATDSDIINFEPAMVSPFGGPGAHVLGRLAFGLMGARSLNNDVVMESVRVEERATDPAPVAVVAEVSIPEPPQFLTPPTSTVAQSPVPPNVTPPALTGPAGRQEWRTPPLWGFRDSGPYLHDGRADTLEQAVSLHGGQAQASATKFFALSAAERRQLEAFLKSLAAPAEGAE